MSTNKIIEAINQENIALLDNKSIPNFGPGDTIKIGIKIAEGSVSRTQYFEGICIGRRNKSINSTFTVRKISYGQGLEKTFPLYSPLLLSIEVLKFGKVRRAKLNYLRDRKGTKATRIKERLIPKEQK